MKQYTKTDKKIDDYLGTQNLRPGPPLRLVNQMMYGHDNTDPIVKQNINHNAFSQTIQRPIPWNEITGIKQSDYGAEEALFLEFLNNRQLVIKVSNDLPLYYFGSLLMKINGIQTPNFRLMEYSDREYQEMITFIEKVSHNDIGIHNKIQFNIKAHAFVLLYEYIPFLSLFELGPNRAHQLFNEKNYKCRELMISLGKILVIDILLNNSNRLPFVSKCNEKPKNMLFKVNRELLPPNAAFKNDNVMVEIDSVNVIDTLPSILNPNEKVMLHNLMAYLHDLDETFKQLFFEFKAITIYGKNVEEYDWKSFAKLKAMIVNSSGYQLTSTNMFHITLGMIVMINQILDEKIEMIYNLIKHVQETAIRKDWADNYKQSANLLNNDYFKHLYEFFSQLKEDNYHIFTWVDETTAGFYQLNPIKVKEEFNRVINEQKAFVYKEQGEIIANKPIKGEMRKEEEKKKTPDFFNYNKLDPKAFSNDVHNGIYDIYDLDDGLIMELRNREYKRLENNPPQPEIIIEPKTVIVSEKQKNLEVENLEGRDSHTIYTLDQLKKKVKKEELFDTLQVKQKHNPEEGGFLESKLNEVDAKFISEQQEQKKKEEEKREKERSMKEKQKDNKSKTNEQFQNGINII